MFLGYYNNGSFINWRDWSGHNVYTLRSPTMPKIKAPFVCPMLISSISVSTAWKKENDFHNEEKGA